jgi:hypothetical protein
MRAPRFRLDLAVRYRALGDEEWRPGKTGNISSSGLLLRTDGVLPVDTRLELRVTLAVNEPTARGGEMSCVGRVVRLVGEPEGAAHAFAVAIDEYALQPRIKLPLA